ncbi:interaptin-like [Saccostrea cucullata]|uniref:interaptin-like n=1 Tax=Saccostrea cuccullata TaxID=36930 RepID=UPI002ED5414D
MMPQGRRNQGMAPAKHNEGISEPEIPKEHIQCDGKINNVSFHLASESIPAWKKAVLDFFDEKKTTVTTSDICCVIKVVFDYEGSVNNSVKINFYQSGSVVIQGAKCVQFKDKYFASLNEKAQNMHEIQESLIADDAQIHECDDNSSQGSDMNDTVLELTDTEETKEKWVTDTNIIDRPNLLMQKVDASCNTEQSDLAECQSITPREQAETQVMTFMSRMESHFTGAIERIFNQHSAILTTKLETMQKLHNQSMQANEVNFTQLLNKFDELMNKTSKLEKENTELKTKMNSFNHMSTLEKEVLKSNLEAKCSSLQQQNDTFSEKMKRYTEDLQKTTNIMADRSAQIDTLETKIASMKTELDKKDEEIVSLKLHNCRDDNSGDFQTKTTRQNQVKPHVTLIGTSNIKGINPDKLSSQYSVNKITAYTLEDTVKEIRNLTEAPDLITLHSLTNDLRNKTPNACVEEMSEICKLIHDKMPVTKIVISLPTPRKDSDEYNTRGQIVTALLKQKLKDDSLVIFCDNSNMAYKGEVILRYVDAKDGYHLSHQGTAVLASNIRSSVDTALNLSRRDMQYKGRGYYNKPYYGNKGRGGDRWRGHDFRSQW